MEKQIQKPENPKRNIEPNISSGFPKVRTSNVKSMASLNAVWYGEHLSMRSTRGAIHEILKFFALGKASLGANPIRKQLISAIV